MRNTMIEDAYEDDVFDLLADEIMDRIEAMVDMGDFSKSFDQLLRKMDLLVFKSPGDLTPEELAFLEAPPPSKHS